MTDAKLKNQPPTSPWRVAPITRHFEDRGRIITTIVGAMIAGVLLAVSTVFAVSLLRQSRDLDRRVQAANADVIDVSVHTISELRTDLFRLRVDISDADVQPVDLEQHQRFLGQQLDEDMLVDELEKVADHSLDEEVGQIVDRWRDNISPGVTALIEARTLDIDPSGVTDVEELTSEIRLAEEQVTELLQFADSSAHGSVAESERASGSLVGDARRLVVTLVVSAGTILMLAGIALLRFRRVANQERQAREELLAVHGEAQTLSAVASQTSNVVIISGPDGLVQWVNEAFTKTSGYTLDEVQGHRLSKFLIGPETDPETTQLIIERFKAGQGLTTEVLSYARDNEPYWSVMDIRPVHSDTGEITNFICIQTDITADRKANDAMREAKEAAEELAKAKAQFLASMSHEIRTPLNAVIGLTDLLLNSDLTDQQREYVQTAHRSGTVLLATISNILTYSVTDSGNVELEQRPFSIHRLAHRTSGLLQAQAREKGLDLLVRLGPDIPELVVGDEARLEQVLINLVGNALKFTETGRVGIEISSNPTGNNLSQLRIDVVDTGIGISAQQIDRIFSPFSQADASTTRKFGGSGLGLAISLNLVELMGGTLSVESEPGKGACFTVMLTLPISHEVMGEEEQPELTPAEETVLRVLLVEDDKVNQMVAQHMLERLGHQVTIANDGYEAVELVVDGFDAVLMDIQMPRMDGLTATTEIRALDLEPQPPIIALTANALEGDRERFVAGGMDSYLSKPFRLAQLADVLAEVIPTSA